MTPQRVLILDPLSAPLVLPSETLLKGYIVPLRDWKASSMESEFEGLHPSCDSTLPDDEQNRSRGRLEP